MLGFVDDLAVLTSALAGLSGYVSPEIRAKVLVKLQAWFGEEAKPAPENFPQSQTQRKT